MKKSIYSDTQIMAILKQAENGVLIADLCREHGMSSASFYKWRSKYGGMHRPAGDLQGKICRKGCQPDGTDEGTR